jgi:tetratricopeptide (TPR) repeat protein
MRSAVFAAVLLVTATARGDVDSPLVKKGVAAYAELDYAKAVQLLEQARKESLTKEEKVVTYQTLAMAHVALGQNDLAKKDFEHLLRIDPSFQLDRSVAPKVRAVFEEAKAQAATSGKALGTMTQVTPTLLPSTLHEGRPAIIHVSYPGGVATKMALYHRRAGEAAYSRLLVDGHNGNFEATVPGIAVQAPGLEYHVALLDDGGADVAAAGSIGSPLSANVEHQTKPVYKKGWFWGVIGGVAAAGAVATALGVVLSRPSTASVTVNPQ